MPISGDRPAHRGTLVAFWSWWWGYPLSFAFLFAFCPQAQKVWGVQLCRWAPHVPMPTSYADLIWYWGGWLSLHRVIRWFICSETPSYKEFGAKGWFYTLWTVCVLAYDTLYTITHDYEHRWCFNIVLCVDNRGGSVNATDPWATQHDGFFRMARPSHGYEELYEPECSLCRCNIHQSLCANIYFSSSSSFASAIEQNAKTFETPKSLGECSGANWCIICREIVKAIWEAAKLLPSWFCSDGGNLMYISWCHEVESRKFLYLIFSHGHTIYHPHRFVRSFVGGSSLQ